MEDQGLISITLGLSFIFIVFFQGSAKIMGAAAIFLVNEIEIIYLGREQGGFNSVVTG